VPVVVVTRTVKFDVSVRFPGSDTVTQYVPADRVETICAVSDDAMVLDDVAVHVEPDDVPSVIVNIAVDGSPVAADVTLPSMTLAVLLAVSVNVNIFEDAFGANASEKNCEAVVKSPDGVVAPQPATPARHARTHARAANVRNRDRDEASVMAIVHCASTVSHEALTVNAAPAKTCRGMPVCFGRSIGSNGLDAAVCRANDCPPRCARVRSIRLCPAVSRVAMLAGVLAGSVLTAGVLRAQSAAPLRWGGDAAGGAPFVEADARDPNRHVGLDVEIAELVAAELGRTPEFVQVPFQSLDQAAVRGDFDIGLSGIEDTPARRLLVPTSIPYYEFHEVLTVRDRDRDRFRSLADLRGHNVATLTGTIAYGILAGAERSDGIRPKWYDDDVAPYSDLAAGRVDAVLLDNVLADRSTKQVPGLHIQPDSVATSHYVIIVSPSDPQLRDRIDEILRRAMRDGRLERILRKWGVWNGDQRPLFDRLQAGAGSTESAASTGSAAPVSKFEMTRAQVPLLLIAAWRTLYLSCLSMALAVCFGMGIAIGRVYGGRVTRATLLTYVEVMRGTPILLQLFIIYYGLPIKLDAYAAALLGLGLNYAAYESEIYRGALEAIPVVQLEAACVLGLTDWQVLRYIRAPQALRLALAPMTNDFVAMLKDSSLVSVIAVTELEQQTQIFATDMRSWVIPGLLCAGLYLAMSLPIAHLARRLEAQWKSATP